LVHVSRTNEIVGATATQQVQRFLPSWNVRGKSYDNWNTGIRSTVADNACHSVFLYCFPG